MRLELARCRYVVFIALLSLMASGCETRNGADQASSSATQNVSSARLDDLIRQFANAQTDSDQETALRSVAAEAFFAEIEESRQLLEKLQGIDKAHLSFEEDIDRRLLIGLLESDIFTADKRRIWTIDPALYVPAGQIGRLLEPASTEPASQRAAALVTLFSELPDQLAHAKENLRNPPRRFTEAAIFKTQGTIQSLTSDGPVLASATALNIDSELADAIALLADYQNYLETEVLPRSNGSWAIGEDHYNYILKHRWFLSLDTNTILARGQNAFETTEALAQEVAARIEPGKHWSEVYETLKDAHPPSNGIKDAYQRAIDEAQSFVKLNQIVTLPEGERVVTIDTPPAMRRSSPFGTFQSVDRFGNDLEGKLLLTPIESWMTPAQQAERLRSHHDAWIPVIAVHEAYPGHHVDALKTRENARLLRKVVAEPIFSEGWGLFTEELMFELGFLKGDDVRLTQLRNRLWRAARVILDVSLHTGEMTFDEAVDFLVERVRFERYAAELEVGMYIQRPTYVLGYLIGMQEIMSIRNDWIAENGAPNPPSEFYDALLGLGSIPPALVRESLIARPRSDSQTGDSETINE